MVSLYCIALMLPLIAQTAPPKPVVAPAAKPAATPAKPAPPKPTPTQAIPVPVKPATVRSVPVATPTPNVPVTKALAKPMTVPTAPAKTPPPVADSKAVATAVKASIKPKMTGPMWSVAFSPDSKTLAVGGYRFVRLYEVETGKRIAEYPVTGEGIRSVSYSADGKELALGTGVPGESGNAFVLDPANGNIIRQVKGHDDTVEGVAFYNNTLLSAADDETVLMTDVTSGQRVGKLTEHNGRCLSVAVPVKFTDDMGGEIFATGGADNMFKIWDAKARRVVVNFDQCASPVWSVAPRPPYPGRFVTGSGDGRLRYWVVYRDKNGKPDDQGVWPRGGNIEAQFDAHEGGVYAVAVAPTDGFVVTGGADSQTALWNTGGGKRKVFTEAKGDIWGVAISPDSKRIASASLDGKARIYDVDKQTLLLTLDASGPYFEPPVKPMKLPAYLPKKLASGTGLTGTYFNNRQGTGKSALVRTDATVSFDMNSEGPAPRVNQTEIFIRWEGFVESPVAGDVKFWTQSDDGVRLWVNGKQVVDSWVDRGPTFDPTEPIKLAAGQRIPIKIEYFQGAGGGMVNLLWEYTANVPTEPGKPALHQDRQVIPKTYLYPLQAEKAVPLVKPSTVPVKPGIVPDKALTTPVKPGTTPAKPAAKPEPTPPTKPAPAKPTPAKVASIHQ